MTRILLTVLWVWIGGFALFGQSEEARKQPREAKPEAMPPEQFSKTHAPLFAAPKSNDAGSLTERLVDSTANGEQPEVSPAPRRNFIDRFIFRKIERDGIPHAPLSTDREFLRRVKLDLTGRIPSPAEVRTFLADRDPAKRDKLIDQLMDREAWVDKWAYFFMDLFRANGKMGRGKYLFHYWMKENLRSDRPYDEVARAIIAASAKSNHVVAAANLIAREHVQGKASADDGDDFGMVHQLDTHDELAIIYAKAFLGINLSCVSCHDGQRHLEEVNVWLSRKTRQEFFQYAAFLGRTRYQMYWENGMGNAGEFIIDDHAPGYDTTGQSMIRVPRLGGSNEPAFILTAERMKPEEEPRDALARMLTSHPQFARATVNLFWAQLMGFGIVEPHDEFDLERQDPQSLPRGWELQPSHPELLNELGKDFERSGYSLKHLMSTICRSSAYQLSARFPGQWKDSYTKYYARKFVRRLGAEELHDAVVLATDRPGNFEFGDGTVGMAMQLSGPSKGREIRYFMETLGQSDRNTPPRKVAGSLLHPLVLMQSPIVAERVLAEDCGRVQQLLDRYSEDSRVVEEMFLATLSRPPSDREEEIALAALRRNRVEGAQNLQWALINNVEFLFNY